MPTMAAAQPFGNLPFDKLPLDKMPLDKLPFAYSELIVLGNSLSDVGNVFIANEGQTPVYPYYDGRFSNGPNYTDHLAETFALLNDPYFDSGTNFAWGGARTSGEPISGLQQLGLYLELAETDPPDKNTLFVVFLGGNNLRDIIIAAGAAAEAGSDPTPVVQAGIGQAMEDMVVILGGLVQAGATNIAVPNVPNLGRAPAITLYQGGILVPLATAATQGYNAALEQLLQSFDPMANIMRVDVYDLFEELAADPGAYGLTNVTDPCFFEIPSGGWMMCPNPDEYLFWDLLHPTTVGHMLLSDTVFDAVLPVPGKARVGRGH